MKKLLIEIAIEKYNLDENKLNIWKTIWRFTVNEDDYILIRESGKFTENRDIIYQAVLMEGENIFVIYNL